MKQTFIQRFMVGVLALTALVAVALPGSASANTTADSKILNVVTVDYKDASGTNNFAATASTSVTVNLVKAALAASNPPTAANATPGQTCPTAGSYASGSTASSLSALTATANGDDTYTLNAATNVTAANYVNNQLIHYSILDYTGAVVSTDPASIVLGSAIPVGVKNDTTLYFPGGSLAGFSTNDIVVLDISGTKKAFLVDSVVVGSAASHTNVGDLPYTVAGTTTAEVKGELTLKAYPDQTILGQTVGGGGTAPTFSTSSPTIGSVVGEMVLVKIDVTASATSTTNPGTVPYTLTATTGSYTTTISCTAGNFVAAALSITKTVRNTSGGSFAATATGNPGDTLEYQVVVTNTSSVAAATEVKVTDPVPAYTTYVANSTRLNSITVTGDGATSPLVSGLLVDNNASRAAGAAATGTLPPSTSATIIYRVKID